MRRPVIVVNMFFAQYNPLHQAHMVLDRYVQSVWDAGGLPILMPVIEDRDMMHHYLELADGVLLIGGKDYPAEYYNELNTATDMSRLRPAFDLEFTRMLLKTSLPVLGICGGCQILAIASGGKLIQDLPNAKQDHTDGKFHRARCTVNGYFKKIVPDTPDFTVNSFHHQAVDPNRPGDGFIVSGLAFDNTVEAIELPGRRMVLGVQFHPERMPELAPRFFSELVSQAKGSMNNKMNNTITIREINDTDELKIIETLAWEIFPETYKELLSPEQIPYMMHMMYDEAVLRKEFAADVHFALILDGNTPVGYISWHPYLCEGKTATKLEKLYLDFKYHGRGLGNKALQFVIETASRTGSCAVLLNVNKENLRAQKAYIRAGFFRWRSEKNPIGNGFYMDDYVMRHDI